MTEEPCCTAQHQETYASRGLNIGNGVEDHVQAAREDTCIVRFTRHSVGLARVGDPVRKEKAVATSQQALHQGQGHTVIDLALASSLVEYMLEGVLGLYTCERKKGSKYVRVIMHNKQ